MYRILTSSDRVITLRAVPSMMSFIRTKATNEAEAGSIATDQGVFGKKEKAEETRWARRYEAEQAAKYRAEHSHTKGIGGQTSLTATEEKLASLEAAKRAIEQEIEDLKRQIY